MYHNNNPLTYYNLKKYQKKAQNSHQDHQHIHLSEHSQNQSLLLHCLNIISNIKQFENFHQQQLTIQEQLLTKYNSKSSQSSTLTQQLQIYTLENCLQYCIEQYHKKQIYQSKIMEFIGVDDIQQKLQKVFQERREFKQKQDELIEMIKDYESDNKILMQKNEKLQEQLKLSKQRQNSLHMRYEYEKNYRNQQINEYLKQLGENQNIQVQKFKKHIKNLQKELWTKQSKIYQMQKQKYENKNKIKSLQQQIKMLHKQNLGLMEQIKCKKQLQQSRIRVKLQVEELKQKIKKDKLKQKEKQKQKQYKLNLQPQCENNINFLIQGRQNFDNASNINKNQLQYNTEKIINETPFFTQKKQTDKKLRKLNSLNKFLNKLDFQLHQQTINERKSKSKRKQSLNKNKKQNINHQFEQIQFQPQTIYGVKQLSRPSSTSSLHRISNTLHFNITNSEQKKQNKMKSIGLMTQPNQQEQFLPNNSNANSPIKKFKQQSQQNIKFKSKQFDHHKIPALNFQPNKMTQSIHYNNINYNNKPDTIKQTINKSNKQMYNSLAFLHTSSSTCLSNQNQNNNDLYKFNKHKNSIYVQEQNKNESYVGSVNKSIHKLVQTLVARRTHKRKSKQIKQETEKQKRKQEQMNQSRLSLSYVNQYMPIKQSEDSSPIKNQNQSLNTSKITNKINNKMKQTQINFNQTSRDLIYQKPQQKNENNLKFSKLNTQRPSKEFNNKQSNNSSGIFNSLCDIMVRKRIKKQ